MGTPNLSRIAATFACFFLLSMTTSAFAERPMVYRQDVAQRGCDPTAHTDRSPRFGAGLELAFGSQRGAQPLNHLAFALGGAWDLHLTSSFGLGGHADFLFGGERGIDANGDGRDDVETGRRRAFLSTAGPRLRVGVGRAASYLGLELGAGYLAEISGGRSGPLLDVGVAFGQSLAGRVELSLRYLQGAGDAVDTRALLLTGTLSTAGGTDVTRTGGCPGFRSEGSSVPYGFGFGFNLFGVNMRRHADAGLPGVTARLLFRLHPVLDLFVEADLLALKRVAKDPSAYHSLALGLRYQDREASPLSIDLSAGYTWAYGTEPRSLGSGPTLAAQLGYDLANRKREGIYLLLGVRQGIMRDNRDLRAIWFGLRMEIRSDAYAR